MVSKRVVQDIVPSTKKPKRSIRSVPIDDSEYVDMDKVVEEEMEDASPIMIKKKNRKTKFEFEEDEESESPASKPIKTKIKSKSSKSPKLLVFLIIFICVATIAVAISLLYTKAIVTITPNKLLLNINGNYISRMASDNQDILNYQVVTVTDEMYKTIPASEGPMIQTKAKGTITLYNTYSTSTQKLMAGTKISNSKNLIYKTSNTITIPGKKLVSGKIVPGSISVGIVADQYGENSNVLLSDTDNEFKVVAYKGSAKYNTIYGKPKTDIDGGYFGKKKIVSPEVASSTILDLQESLKNKLLQNIATVIPKEMVLFNNAYTIEYQKLPQKNMDGNTVNIGVKGSLYGIVFNKIALIEFIAKKQLDDSRLNSYSIDGLDTMKFKILNTRDFSAKKGTALSLSLNGPLTITGTFQESEFKKKLLGIKLKDMDPIIKQYTSIKSVSVLLTPFWMRSFPNSAQNIIIEYK